MSGALVRSAALARPCVQKCRILVVGWLLLYVPTYWQAYGAMHFLQLCNVGVLLACAGYFAQSGLLLSTQAIALPPIGLLWAADLVVKGVTGEFLHGGTAYLWNADVPLLARILSGYHIVLPALLLLSMCRRGYQRHALLWQAGISAVVMLLSWGLAINQNLNFVASWPNGAVLFEQSLMHASASWIILLLCFYLPTHVFWRTVLRILGRRRPVNSDPAPC